MKKESTYRYTLENAPKGKTNEAYLDSFTEEQLIENMKSDPDWDGNHEID